MLSTLYMAAFAFKYWFHDVPFYRLSRDQSDRERHGEPSVISPKISPLPAPRRQGLFRAGYRQLRPLLPAVSGKVRGRTAVVVTP